MEGEIRGPVLRSSRSRAADVEESQPAQLSHSVHEGEPVSLDDCRRHLMLEFPGRKSEIGELLNILGEPVDTFPALLVHGGAATGKTSVIKRTFALLKRPFVYVSCRSCHSPRLIFESVLNQLLGHVRCKANNYSSAKKCDKIVDFVSLVVESCTRGSFCRRRVVYLVFDDVELIRKWNSGDTLMSSLLTLSHLTGLSNLGIVFVSNAGPDTLQLGTQSRDIFSIYFREYTNEELYAILVKWQPDSELFSFFLRFSLAPFGRASRRLTELFDGLHPVFEKYCEMVRHERSHPQEKGKQGLFAYLKRHMQLALSQTFCITGSDSHSNSDMGSGVGQKGNRQPHGAMEFQLPLCSKFLLLASYIASRNPSTLDDGLFGTGEGTQARKRKRRSSILGEAKSEEEANERHLKGPSSFPLERLLAIYKCLALQSGLETEPGWSSLFGRTKEAEESSSHVTADLLMQLTSLTSVNLVQRNWSCPLDAIPRFRCNVDAEFISKVCHRGLLLLGKEDKGFCGFFPFTVCNLGDSMTLSNIH